MSLTGSRPGVAARAMLALVLAAPALDAGAQLFEPGPTGLRFEVVARAVSADGAPREVALRDGGVLRSGDELQFRIRTRSDAYVYVVAHGSSGAATLLRPFSGDAQDARVRGGEEVIFPGPGEFLPLDDRTGAETVYAIATEQPVDRMSSLLVRMEAQGEDRDAVTRLVAAEFDGFSRVAFQHIGHAPLVGIGLAGTARQTPLGTGRVSETPQDVPTGVSSAVASAFSDAAPDEPAAPRPGAGAGDEPYREEGVLSATGSRIAAVTGDAPDAGAAPAAAAASTPEARPSASPEPAPPAEAPASEPAGFGSRLGRLFGFGGGGDPGSAETVQDAPEAEPEAADGGARTFALTPRVDDPPPGAAGAAAEAPAPASAARGAEPAAEPEPEAPPPAPAAEAETGGAPEAQAPAGRPEAARGRGIFARLFGDGSGAAAGGEPGTAGALDDPAEAGARAADESASAAPQGEEVPPPPPALASADAAAGDASAPADADAPGARPAEETEASPGEGGGTGVLGALGAFFGGGSQPAPPAAAGEADASSPSEPAPETLAAAPPATARPDDPDASAPAGIDAGEAPGAGDGSGPGDSAESEGGFFSGLFGGASTAGDGTGASAPGDASAAAAPDSAPDDPSPEAAWLAATDPELAPARGAADEGPPASAATPTAEPSLPGVPEDSAADAPSADPSAGAGGGFLSRLFGAPGGDDADGAAAEPETTATVAAPEPGTDAAASAPGAAKRTPAAEPEPEPEPEAVVAAAPDPDSATEAREPAPAPAVESPEGQGESGGGFFSGLFGGGNVAAEEDAAAAPTPEDAAAAPEPEPRPGPEPEALAAAPEPAPAPDLPGADAGGAPASGAGAATGSSGGGFLGGLFGGGDASTEPDADPVETAAAEPAAPAPAPEPEPEPVAAAPAPESTAPAAAAAEEPESPGFFARLGGLFGGGSSAGAPPADEAPPAEADASSRAEADAAAVVSAGAAAQTAPAPEEPKPFQRVGGDRDRVLIVEGTAAAPPSGGPRAAGRDAPAPASGTEVLGAEGSKIAALLDGEPESPALPESEPISPAPATAAPVPGADAGAPSAAPAAGSGTAPAPDPAVTASAARPDSSVEEIAAAPAAAPAIAAPAAAPPGAGSGPVIAADPVQAMLEQGGSAGSAPSTDLAAIGHSRVQSIATIDLQAGDGVAAGVVMVVAPGASGSGALIDDRGHVLTTWHVVQGYPAVTVLFKEPGSSLASESRIHRAEVIKISKFSDLALLRIEDPPADATPVPLAAGGDLADGAVVHAIGHPAAGGWSHTIGKVSRVRPASSWYSGRNVLHRGAVINARVLDSPGSDGAPLLNNDLELVGLTATSRLRRGEMTAISMDTIRAFLAPPGSDAVAASAQ